MDNREGREGLPVNDKIQQGFQDLLSKMLVRHSTNGCKSYRDNGQRELLFVHDDLLAAGLEVPTRYLKVSVTNAQDCTKDLNWILFT